MRQFSRCLALILSISISGLAQSQIATINSVGSFQLRGATVNPRAGVPGWPVAAGDTIQAGNELVTLTFLDGSTIVLAPHATARVDVQGGTPVFRLNSIAPHYVLRSLNAVKLMLADEAVTPEQLEGDLRFGDRKPLAAGWWTAKHTGLVLVGVAGAVGVAVGLSKRNGDQVSPSR